MTSRNFKFGYFLRRGIFVTPDVQILWFLASDSNLIKNCVTVTTNHVEINVLWSSFADTVLKSTIQWWSGNRLLLTQLPKFKLLKYLHWGKYHRIYDTSNCESSSNDGAYRCQKMIKRRSCFVVLKSKVIPKLRNTSKHTTINFAMQLGKTNQ